MKHIIRYTCTYFIFTLLLFCFGCSKNENSLSVMLVYPKNNAEEIDYESVTLKWSDVQATYTLNYGTTNSPENTINGIDATSYKITNLKPGTTYYWTVGVEGSSVQSLSGTWKFTTLPAKKLELISPQNSTQLSYLYPVLRWNIAGSSENQYHIYMGSDTTSWEEIGVTADNSFSPENLEWSTGYYWKVVSVNEQKEEIHSETWSFNTPAPSKQDYSSYKGLVMAGYQGWFAAQGDGSNLSWGHYNSVDGEFSDGFCSIDFWPDVSEYDKTYETNFVFDNGDKARLFSSYDEQTVLTHFKWMEEYGIDGVFMQRFMSEIKYRKARGYKVFANAMKGAEMYNRAICLMYDGGVGTDDELLRSDLLETDGLYDLKNNPNYLKHNGRPLVALWGIAFTGRPDATPEKTSDMIDWLHNHGFSVMLGVNDTWRTQDSFHAAIKKADIIHPWFVGRYGSVNSFETNFLQKIKYDIAWCKNNEVDYVPTVFPGFSWHNMYNDSKSNQIPRDGGDFLWGQVYGNISEGAEMIYVAMFDELDEGTCIFKCVQDVPRKPSGSPASTIFVPYTVEPDHYLWLTGEAARMLRKELPLTSIKPQR